jgi:beta-lactamase class D
MRSAVLLLFGLLLILPGRAEEEKLASLFNEAGAVGTFVLVSEEKLQVHNVTRAETRYVPASTFKIANTIVALEVGSVSNVDEVLPYGGKPQFLKIWERDMSLREALPISNVPIYQELARRTGLEAIKTWLAKLDYGNADPGAIVDRFWLDGPLKISAIEQAQFLQRLATRKLPIQEKTFAQVSDITVTERGPGWVLHSKTGWFMPKDATHIGWWVGWIEKEGAIHTFALNIDMPNEDDAAKRIPLGRKCLAALGIIPESTATPP